MQKLLIILKLFAKDVQKQRLRTFMTMFGIVWGTVALIVLMSFGEGIYRQTEREFHGLGENIVIMWPGSTKKPYRGLPKGRVLRMEPNTADFLKSEVPEIVQVSPEFSGTVTMRVGRKTASVQIAGVYPEYGSMRNVIPESGRFINPIDQEYRKRSIFIGTNVRNDFFGEGADAIGKYVYVNGVPFMVVGVLKDKEQNSSYNSRDVDRTYIASRTYEATFGEKYPDNFVYQISDPLEWRQVQTKVFKALGARYAFDPSDKEAMWLWDLNENEEEFAPFFTGFRAFLGIVGIFTLIVGGIGTANIMYVVVKERSKEIGIKMALGATKLNVMGQILGEALMLTGIGGFVGFLISEGMIALFPYLDLEKYVGTPTIAPWVAVSSITVLMLLGLLAGFFPARRAANLNPVECLRL